MARVFGPRGADEWAALVREARADGGVLRSWKGWQELPGPRRRGVVMYARAGAAGGQWEQPAAWREWEEQKVRCAAARGARVVT